ncbi:MAG: hypothetical protein IMY86_11215, partial [Chloroflexi bacterium]|nr:hypothetical protein [Chloroflexota bacterium]
MLPELRPGTLVQGRYLTAQRLGSGGMEAVYLAQYRRLGWDIVPAKGHSADYGGISMQKKILPIIASVLASASLLIALLLLLGDVHAEAAPTATDTTAVRLAAGVGLSPGYSQEAEPGTVVTYTHILTNTGTVTDTFRLGATNSRGWTVTLGGGDGPTSTLEVSGGATDTFTVSVAVPLTAMADITASTFITATSQVTPTALDTITDITTVTQIAGVELSPGYSRTVEPGTVATYTHVITNTGWSEATFHLTHHSSRNWTVEYVTPITLDGSLSGRNTTTLVVSVTVPPDAGGLTDETTITATGPLDALATATDTTVVSEGMRYIYLPLVM